MSSANAGGKKRDNQLEIIDNHSAFGRSRLALASFNTQSEAQNFYDYVSSYVVRFAFLMTDDSLKALALKVPDIGDYSNSNRFIDFSGDVDSQLFSILKLTDEEIAYLKDKVDNWRNKNNEPA